MKSISRVLEHNGMTVTSRWLEERIPESSQLHDVTPAFCRETAIADLQDICKSDTMVFFSEDPTIGTPRGGRHFEMGYALAMGKDIHIIGKHENIFHFLPCIKLHNSVEDFLEATK
jgi:hypothetical protein